MAMASQTYEQARTQGNSSFADEWGRVQKQLAAMTSGQRASQFGYTSLAAGEYVKVLDTQGQAKMRIGHQSDGTVAVVYGNGSPPPVPTTPVVSARQLGLYIQWDGTFAGGYARPGDVVRCDAHMSEDADFVPDGTTVVGSIPAKGGILVGADSLTHYVRLVAVTNADVASAPTPITAILPLPAGQVAVGAIGADQLAANLALVSRLIAGDPAGGRLELEGRPGMESGLHLYNADNVRTLRLSALTGDVSFMGELRTDDTGERLVIAEDGANDIRFYPTSGDLYSRLSSRTFVDGALAYSGASLDGPLYNALRSSLDVRPNYVALGRRTDAGTYQMGVLCNDEYTQVLSKAFAWRFEPVNNNTQGVLYAPSINTGVIYTATGITVYNSSTGALKAVSASNVSTSSSESGKTAIEDIPFDAVAAVRNAPVRMWERRKDPKGEDGRRRKNVGPMAERVPAVCQARIPVVDGPDELGIDLGSQLGVLWAAVAQLADRIDNLAPKGVK